jgi:O-antigen/teichoic acid export membrane protein
MFGSSRRPSVRAANLVREDGMVRRTLHGMAVLAGGSGASKLITLVSLPIITRLYLPADMGALAVFAAFVVLLSPVLTFQYHRALPVPRSDTAAANLMVLSFFSVLGISVALSAVLWFAAEPLLWLLSMEALLPYWWLLPLGTAVYALYGILQLWATRRRAYRLMAAVEVGHSLGGNGAKIGLAFVLPPPVGLLLGHVFAPGGGVLWLVAQFRFEIRKLLRRVRPTRIRAMAWHYRQFPIFRMPSQLLLMLSSQTPVLFIAAVYGPATAGQFGLAMMALSMPMNLLGRNMGKAFFGEAAHQGRAVPTALRKSVLRVTGLMASVGVMIAAALILAAPPLFPLLFGPDWDEAGRFAATLALFLAFQFAAVPVMNVLSVLEREVVYLQLDLQRVVLLLLVFGVSLALALTALQFILMYSLAMALHYIVCFLRVLRELKLTNKIR